MRGPDDVLLLDEPDNYLDVPGKRWLEQRLVESTKSVLLISHDRELLDRVANRIVTIEGGTAWTHGGGFASYHQAAQAPARSPRRGAPAMGRRAQAARRLVSTLQQQAKNLTGDGEQVPRDANEAGEIRRRRPTAVRPATTEGGDAVARRTHRAARGHVRTPRTDRPRGSRSTSRSSTASGWRCSARTGLASRTSCGCSRATHVRHTGVAKLGARVVPGWFAQTHEHGEFAGRTLAEVLWADHARDRGRAMNVLRRYELDEPGRPAVRHVVGRPAGAVSDPAARDLRRDAAATRRAHRQPRRRQRRSTRGRARQLRRHRDRGDPRPVVRALLRAGSWSSAPTLPLRSRPSRSGTRCGRLGDQRRWARRPVSPTNCGRPTTTSAATAIDPAPKTQAGPRRRGW